MRQKQRLELTARDLKILEFIFEQRVISFTQIAKRFFDGVGIPSVFKRLDKLSQHGFLRKFYDLWEGSRCSCYGITEKGIRSIGDSYRYKITSPDFKSDSIRHDLGLVRLRSRLEKLKMLTEYLSESMLQSCKGLAESEKLSAFSRLNSDAALVLKTPKTNVIAALEYEISDKAESRYSKKLTDYYISRNIGAILYVCGDGGIESLIRQTDMEIGQKYPAKVFTCLEENVLQADSTLTFLNRENGALIIE